MWRREDLNKKQNPRGNPGLFLGACLWQTQITFVSQALAENKGRHWMPVNKHYNISATRIVCNLMQTLKYILMTQKNVHVPLLGLLVVG